MKYRPSLAFACCLIPLLAAGAAGAVAWHKATSVPLAIRVNAEFFEALKFAWSPKSFPITPEEAKQLKWDARVMKAKLMAEFPALIVTPRPVPDQENGFLQLHLLANSDEGLPVSSEIYSLLSEPNGWNAKAAARLLEEHSELVNRIEHIAALPRHSSSNMPDDFDGFIRARNGKTSSDILLIKARLAAEAGDEAETLRLVAAVQNICSHYREVESPNFLGETVTVLVDREADAGRSTDCGGPVVAERQLVDI